jgi:hypothetical protein
LDKIGKMYRSGEIGGRIVGGDGPTSTSPVSPQPRTKVAAADSLSPGEELAPVPRIRQLQGAPIAVPPEKFERPAVGSGIDRGPAPGAILQPDAPPQPDAHPAPASGPQPATPAAPASSRILATSFPPPLPPPQPPALAPPPPLVEPYQMISPNRFNNSNTNGGGLNNSGNNNNFGDLPVGPGPSPPPPPLQSPSLALRPHELSRPSPLAPPRTAV